MKRVILVGIVVLGAMYLQRGDTTCTIQTKTVESYNAVKK